MEGTARRFYGDRAAEAADAVVGTKGYEEQERKALKLLGGLRAASTESQKRLFLEWEHESGELGCIVDDAIYKAGFLDGIAMAMTSAACADRISEAQKSAFHLGYEEGKVAR
jgi:hypothetical protein